jgi:hypothetical protein
MSNISTATYIKKLVKLVYEREKQIENLKKELRDVGNPNSQGEKEKVILKEHANGMIDDHIKSEMFHATAQLREVNMQMNAMEKKMVELELGLQEETIKNQEYEEEVVNLKTA